MVWDKLANDTEITKTISALKKSGITAIVVKNQNSAKNKILKVIPKGAEVMNMTSVTLNTISIAEEIQESGRYDSVKNKLASMNRQTQSDEMQKLGAAPKWAIGSCHALTQDGKILVASNTGSQLGAYAYGSSQVIFVVGAQKIVKDINYGLKRIYEYVLPLEDKRAKAAYGTGSNVSKLLIINKEVKPGRITVIIVKEKLGF